MSTTPSNASNIGSLTDEPTLEGPLVLVIDDDEDTRFVYAECLVQLGYRTAGECDAARGIAAALRLRPDAILMDVAMPGMNGVEAARILKADARTRDCLLVMVTGSGMKWFEEARAAGCDAFFGKPFDPASLQHILPARPPAPAPAPEPLPPEVVKRCACGRDYTRDGWLALPRAGRMHLTERDAVVELRHCPCGSSMMLALDSLLEPTEESPAESAHASPELQTIVVVDRDVHVRQLVLHFIGDAYLVEFLGDGYAALDRVRRSPPAAVVAEVMIPRLDGLALCKLIKGDPSTAQVPVLLFSMLPAVDRARQAGANAFLTKPLEKETFVASLLKLMERRAVETRLPCRIEESDDLRRAH